MGVSFRGVESEMVQVAEGVTVEGMGPELSLKGGSSS